jgi:hypothetical protein
MMRALIGVAESRRCRVISFVNHTTDLSLPAIPLTMSNSPSLEQLKRAVTIAEEIDRLQSRLSNLLGGQGSAQVGRSSSSKAQGGEAASSGSGKRTVSAATRAKMIAAQRARWEKAKGNQGGETSAKAGSDDRRTGARRKRGSGSISAEARARMAEAARRRWAAAKRAGKNSL